VAPLAALGVRDAVVTLLSGPWAELVFCTGVPDPSGERLATYAAPETATNALLLVGSATLGRGPDDEPLVHAHGAFVAADGRLGGGHLLPDRCVAGDAPTTAFVTIPAGIEIAQVADAETNHRLLRPFAAGERADG